MAYNIFNVLGASVRLHNLPGSACTQGQINDDPAWVFNPATQRWVTLANGTPPTTLGDGSPEFQAALLAVLLQHTEDRRAQYQAWNTRAAQP